MAKSIKNTNPSQYKKEEDRVTAALLQVMQYGGHPLVCYLFGESDLPSNDINVIPQVVKDSSRPDGEISCDCRYHIYIESKIRPGMMKNDHEKKQLQEHLKLVSVDSYLVYLTPDTDRPNELQPYSNITWMNWATIIQKLEGYDNPDRLVSFLIDQLKLLVENVVYNKSIVSDNGVIIAQRGNIDKDQTVIIVGGKWGEEVALRYGFYACQPGRYFAPAKYITFCHNQRIENLFEILEDPVESVVLDANNIPQDYLETKDPNYDKSPRKLFKLKHVKKFSPAIQNDKVDHNGKPCAYVQKQAYTTYDKITSAKRTSEL